VDEDAKAASIDLVARALLRRYRFMFWKFLARESEQLPPWRRLLRVYRRLEARAETRGGRFVAGFSGEQYALPKAVGLLREVRRRPARGEWISLSAADPLNLIGVLTPGPRLAPLMGNRLIYRDGLPVTVLAGGKAQFLAALDQATQWEAEKKLMRSTALGLLAGLA
jgi:ATP-dependent Lhr-like helicase